MRALGLSSSARSLPARHSLEPETAIQFEKVLGVDADLWLSIESGYQLHRAREADAARAKDAIAWSKTFPINDLVKRRCFPKPVNPVDAVSKLLAFFGVGSLDAWNSQYGLAKVAYRHSPSFTSNEVALATWLRLGELDAEQQECADYSETQFKLGV
jgi:HTH-type transcriptional regulator/antitoxin HigA